MITLSETAEDILAGNSFAMYSRLVAYQGDTVLAEDIPAYDVLEEQDASLRVPERLTFKVPAEDDDGNVWIPTEWDSPLGPYGQTVRAQVGIGTARESVEWLDRGEFLVNSADTDGDSVSVECLGLLQLLEEAQLPNEYQPKASATLGSIMRALVEPGITVDLDDAPTDRTAPSHITWSDNRLDDVYSVLDAWPARGYIDNLGFLVVEAALEDPETSDVVFALTEDESTGTVMRWSTSVTREGAFNAVIARGQYPDTAGALAGQEILSTAYDNAEESPYRLNGPFSPYLVPFGYASPLLTTQAMVVSAAATRFQTLRRKASRTVFVTCVPHPALKLGDAVSVTSDRLGLSAELGRIDAFTLPHLPEGGSMGLTVRIAGVT